MPDTPPAGAATVLDSTSVGEPERFMTFDDLVRGLARLRPPRDSGRVRLVVRSGEGGRRETLREALLTPDGGVPGDAWARHRRKRTESQLAVMQSDVSALIANGQPLELFGDNLILELDLSSDNLPAGSRLKVGEALLEVTSMPHNGCRKFQSRFGEEALRFVSDAERRHLNLRGIYMCVVEAGTVRPGDAVHVLQRPEA